jgi:hypothetical protein
MKKIAAILLMTTITAWAQGGSYFSFIGKVGLTSEISQKELLESPDWKPESVLPLSISDAVALARQELQKHADDLPDWEPSSIELKRVPLDAATKWYYVVKFDQKPSSTRPSGSAQIVVGFNKYVGKLTPQPDHVPMGTSSGRRIIR